MYDLQSTPLVVYRPTELAATDGGTESVPDAVTQSSGESRTARRRKLRQAHVERLRSTNLVSRGASDDSSGSLRREPFSEGTVSTMQCDVSVLQVSFWTLPNSGVPKFNPEVRPVWGEHAVALTCAQRKQLQQTVLISKANPASEAEREALAKECAILFFQLHFLDDSDIWKERADLILSPCYAGLYGRCGRYDLQQVLQGGARYK
ncbi:unnamed protein product [Polarella glacialis]|uniref:Uncharacterized protein n=1 Tax=Polarella glacialis TaxID=89957 RepID=A0A813KID0_POLGL|nr:unnamed protein product [Polarella glacialis]